MKTIGALIFPAFETLDLFGPIQMFGSVRGAFQIATVAEQSGEVSSRHGQKIVVDHTFVDSKHYDLLLVPGGPGTWDQIDNAVFLNWVAQAAERAQLVMSVCTGTAFLAKAELLKGRAATTNKLDFDWVAQFGKNIDWRRQARWVHDGKFFTSSGVSAGMDMSLAVIEELLDLDAANGAATHSEYIWHRDPSDDPFALAMQ